MTFMMSKEIQFDAGHRVPDHDSKCRNPHGHRYRVEARVGAEDLVAEGSASGMVLDFGYVKKILTEYVHDPLDHGFIVFENDFELKYRLGVLDEKGDNEDTPDWKVIVFPYIPTAENIARWIYEQMEEPIRNAYNESAYLDSIKVWETPTSSAVFWDT